MLKLIKILVFSLCGVGSVLWIVILNGGVEFADTMFAVAYVLLAIPIVTGGYFAVKKFIETPENLKKVLFLLIGVVVVVGVSYMMSDDTPVKGSSPTVSSWVDTGLYVFYIQALVVVGLMLYFSIRRVNTNKK